MTQHCAGIKIKICDTPLFTVFMDKCLKYVCDNVRCEVGYVIHVIDGLLSEMNAERNLD